MVEQLFTCLHQFSRFHHLSLTGLQRVCFGSGTDRQTSWAIATGSRVGGDAQDFVAFCFTAPRYGGYKSAFGRILYGSERILIEVIRSLGSDCGQQVALVEGIDLLFSGTERTDRIMLLPGCSFP
jgi:hypothetical protein